MEALFFLTLKGWGQAFDKYQLGDLLTPEVAVSFMQKIVSEFVRITPSSKIVFLNFPYNTYASDAGRVERTKAYEKLFSHSAAISVPCLTIRKSMQTKDKQHFDPRQYAAYAGLVHQLIK